MVFSVIEFNSGFMSILSKLVAWNHPSQEDGDSFIGPWGTLCFHLPLTGFRQIVVFKMFHTRGQQVVLIPPLKLISPLKNNFHVLTQYKCDPIGIAPVPFLFYLHTLCTHRSMFNIYRVLFLALKKVWVVKITPCKIPTNKKKKSSQTNFPSFYLLTVFWKPRTKDQVC